MTRIRNAYLRSKIVSADEAAALIPSGVNVGMSGFTCEFRYLPATYSDQ
jgi:succinyl-CoA:acetate CoA-transferase